MNHLLDSPDFCGKNQTFDRRRFDLFVSCQCRPLHASHAFLMVINAGLFSIFTHCFICCVRALQHHQASSAFSLGSEFPTFGNLPVSPPRIHDKHKHIYPRRFFRAFLFLFFWGHQKANRISGYALETWDHGLTALSKHYFHNCFFFFSSTCTEVQHVAYLIAMPSITAGCAEYPCFGAPG